MKHEKDWEEFRKNGLLWFTNTILHLFGYAITMEYDENHKLVDIYPNRVAFRGFSEECNTRGYDNVTKYLQKNIDTLAKESDPDRMDDKEFAKIYENLQSNISEHIMTEIPLPYEEK